MANSIAIVFATVLRVVDGDTLIVDFDCNIDFLCKAQEVRLAGIDTPEMHGKCQLEKDLAMQAKKLTEATYPKGTVFPLASPEKDKYGRLLGEAPILSKKLLDAGLAVVYHGKKKTHDWCVPAAARGAHVYRYA